MRPRINVRGAYKRSIVGGWCIDAVGACIRIVPGIICDKRAAVQIGLQYKTGLRSHKLQGAALAVACVTKRQSCQKF